MTKDSFASILAKASKKYDLRIGNMNSVLEDVDAISTGSIAFDNALGVGGFPRGRSIELYGPPSSGKTTAALMAMASAQKLITEGHPDFKGKKLLYMDHEHAVDLEYAKKLGLDAEDESFLIAQPDSFEQSANISFELISTGEIAMATYDSVAAMVSEKALEAEIGKSLPAIQARLMSDFLKKLNGTLNETKTSAIFLNHIMEVMEMGGKPGYKKYSTPGGRALKFYASVRVEFQQVGNLKGTQTDELTKEETEIIEATDVRIRIVKNKVAPPFKQAKVRVRFGRGFDNAYTALQILKGRKKLPVTASRFHYFHLLPELITDDMLRTPAKPRTDPRPYIDTEARLFDKLDADPVWRQKFIDAAIAALSDEIPVEEVSPDDILEMAEEAAENDIEPSIEDESEDGTEDAPEEIRAEELQEILNG